MNLDGDGERLKTNDMVVLIFHQTAFDHYFIGLFLILLKEIYSGTESHLMNELVFISFIS